MAEAGDPKHHGPQKTSLLRMSSFIFVLTDKPCLFPLAWPSCRNVVLCERARSGGPTPAWHGRVAWL